MGIPNQSQVDALKADDLLKKYKKFKGLKNKAKSGPLKGIKKAGNKLNKIVDDVGDEAIDDALGQIPDLDEDGGNKSLTDNIENALDEELPPGVGDTIEACGDKLAKMLGLDGMLGGNLPDPKELGKLGASMLKSSMKAAMDMLESVIDPDLLKMADAMDTLENLIPKELIDELLNPCVDMSGNDKEFPTQEEFKKELSEMGIDENGKVDFESKALKKHNIKDGVKEKAKDTQEQVKNSKSKIKNSKKKLFDEFDKSTEDTTDYFTDIQDNIENAI